MRGGDLKEFLQHCSTARKILPPYNIVASVEYGFEDTPYRTPAKQREIEHFSSHQKSKVCILFIICLAFPALYTIQLNSILS